MLTMIYNILRDIIPSVRTSFVEVRRKGYFMRYIIYTLVYLGSALMVYNIYGFIRFARDIRSRKNWDEENMILYIPIVLLVLFLIGYLAVGFFGKPDLIIAGILFGGSIFVYIMYQTLSRIAQRIIEGEHMEAQLMAAEESNRAKTAFLASVSHEMRTPMNVILGLDNVALKEPSLPEETRGHLQKIDASARHLLDLINNLLDMNSIEQDKLVVKNELFSLRDTLEQVNAIVDVSCNEKGLDYHFTASDCLDRTYRGDELQLKHVLFNLLDNAVKYTDAPGTVDLSVEEAPSSSDQAGTCLRFTVKDTGVGIDPEFLPKVFDAFSQEDDSFTNLHGGSGLGLAATKRILKRLGGTITAASEKNVGSVFTVTLPLEIVEDAAPSPQTAEEDVSLEGRRILIVEDIPENAEIVADLLELEGAESDHAENGKVGLEMFLAAPANYYDAILMDLRMPVMDGLTAAKEIRRADHADAKTIPIIALTANAFSHDIKQTQEAGMNAHLSKPADADMLYTTLKSEIKRNGKKG